MFQTPFVRQNTPHPRELKAKAHKLFGKGGKSPDAKDVEDVGLQHTEIPVNKMMVTILQSFLVNKSLLIGTD